MSWPAYPEYKDSGTDWLGDMPSHWVSARLKNVVLSIDSGTSVNGAESPAGPDEIGVLKTSCVSAGWFNAEANKTVIEDDISRVTCPVQRDTLIVNRANTPLLVGSAGYVRDDLRNIYLSDKLWQVRFDGAFAAFVYYWAQTPFYRSQIAAQCVGASSSMQNLSMADFRNVALALPPGDEQASIVDFLSVQTAKIDTLIGKQKQLIATLREDRTATITHAVTKGIAPGVQMKDSGLAWVEYIPRHWKVVNIRRMALMKTGHTPSRSIAAYWENTTIPWFTLADVWQLRDGKRMYLEEDTSNRINELGLANSAAELLPPTTVVLSRTASVGFSGIMPIPMATSQDFWNWVCGPQLLPEYLMYAFRAMQGHFSALMIGSTHKTIYQADAAAIRIPLPPLSEQREITQRVSEELAVLDALSAKATEVIGTLREYRSALITDAVTGKIDVRGAVA